MKNLTEKELYSIQLSITKELFGDHARICPKRNQVVVAALKGAINQLEKLGIASYNWPEGDGE